MAGFNAVPFTCARCDVGVVAEGGGAAWRGGRAPLRVPPRRFAALGAGVARRPLGTSGRRWRPRSSSGGPGAGGSAGPATTFEPPSDHADVCTCPKQASNATPGPRQCCCAHSASLCPAWSTRCAVAAVTHGSTKRWPSTWPPFAPTSRRRGLSAADAEAAARRAFGGVDQFEARYRDQRGWPALDALGQDLRFAGRYLQRDRAFAVPVVAVLALGIGVGHMFLTLTYAHTCVGCRLKTSSVCWSVSTVDGRGAARRCRYAGFRRPARRAAELRPSRGPCRRAGHARTSPSRSPERRSGAFTTAAGSHDRRASAARSGSSHRPTTTPGAAATVRARPSASGGAATAATPACSDATSGERRATAVVGVVSDRSGFPSGATVFLPLSALAGQRWPTRA